MSISKPIRIVAMAKYLPRQVSSTELEIKYKLPKNWSVENSGVEYRHQISTENNGIMGAKAADLALEKANMTLADIDMIISAGATYDYPIPNQASVTKAEMKDGHKYHTPSIDIDSTCLSFVVALDLSSKILDGKQYKNVLIISAETASKGLNISNWETLTLFGDAAVAAVISFDKESSSEFIKGGHRTYSEGVYDTMIEGGGVRNFFSERPYDNEFYSFKMNGKKLLRMAKDKIPEFMEWFFSDIPYTMKSTDVIIPHQASKIGLMMFKKMFDLKDSQIKETLLKYGNCIAASIPLTLCDSIENNEIKRGDLCFLSGTSAGFSIGGVLIRY